ncbi:MAG: hypothetical protein MJB57_16745 [Gemmatimonadetes bacterium]|nr:hypothetical protein [Gemmatimonadota bacterium]
MVRRGFFTASIVALGLSSTALAAQTDDLARVRAAYGEVDAARIAAVIQRGVDNELPRRLLVEKALEGTAKRMPADAVLAAVTTLERELRAAATVVWPDQDAETLEKTADALRHGIDRALLVELHRERPEEFPMMIVAIEDLIHVGVDPDVAEDMVRAAATSGLSGHETLGLPATVRRLVREGSTPRDAASSVRAGIRPGGTDVPPSVDERFRDVPSTAGGRGRSIPPIL